MFHFKLPERILSSLQKREARFEYDPSKSKSNKEKHGIDFEEAQALWDGPVLEVKLAYEAEDRFACIGIMDGKHWTAIITYRGEAVRLISMRRSHKDEERAYDERV